MAQVIKSHKIEIPYIPGDDYKTAKRLETEAREALRESVMSKTDYTYAGHTIKFPIADGYAEYMVAGPTKLIHIDIYDGYRAMPATIRGLRAKDIVEEIEGAKRWDAMFTKQGA